MNDDENARLIRQLLDQLPIYATTIGYRFNSTDEERALGEALFKVHEAWQEVKP